MSYEISLYKPAYIHRAIEQGLDDWTHADPIPATDLETVIQRLIAKGYIERSHPWNGGSRCFAHPVSALLIEAHIFEGCVSFGVSAGDAAELALTAAFADAREAAKAIHLALYDPQTGQIED